MNKNILIADDEESIRKLLIRFLSKDGYQLFTASNGKEAVEFVKKNRVDLAILDMVMPEMDGVEALKQIKAMDPAIEILMITGKANIHVLKKVLFEYGAYDYLLKPFDMVELKLTIERALHGKKLAQKSSYAMEEMQNRITELEKDFKKKTFQLRESQIKYKNIVENSTDAIVVTQDGYVKFANKIGLELSGYSQEEIVAIPFLEMLHPEDRVEARKRYDGRMSDAELTPTNTLRVLKKDGTVLWIENQAVKSIWQDKPATLNFMRDLTRRIQDKEALLVKDSAIETSKTAFVFTDLHGNITYVNNSFLKMWGHRQRDHALGKKIQALWPTPNGFEENRQSLLEKGEWTGEMAINGEKRQRKHLQFSVNMVTDQANKPFCMMVSFVDITEQKMAKEAMARSEKLVSLGQLSAGLAHELRNPLAVISSCSQFCLENKKLERLVKENFQVIHRSSKRASNLISELLAFARPDRLEWKKVDVNQVIRKMLRMAELGSNISHMTFSERFGKGLPQISGDGEKLGQVILNLLQNAIQATAGKGEIIIETGLSDLSDMVEIKITDNGPGIPEDYRPQVFNPFFTTKDEGTGLGLSICHTIVDQHQGNISVDCGEKKGTQVLVTLPAKNTPHVEHNHAR